MARAPVAREGRPGVALCIVALLVLAAGCQGGGGGPLARWRMAHDDVLAKPPTDEELGGRRGLIGRLLNPGSPPATSPNVGPELVLGSDGRVLQGVSKPDPEAEAELAQAETLFQQGQLVEAERIFKRLARKKKDTSIGEKARFYLAESLFQRGKLRAAHDNYEALIADYPGSKYLDRAVRREYAIADSWLKAIDEETPPEARVTMADRFSGRVPFLDISGNALAALEHVRHHDPTGPLADDAALRIADYHFKQGNYEDAAMYYDQLITEHPKSQLLQRAQLASIDAKVRAYLGPDYDGTGLEQAREQIVQTMTLFPEQQASYSKELYQTLAVIDDQMAERTYRIGEHYLWTGKVASAEYYFGEIPAKWPKSSWAEKAKERLAAIATMPRKPTIASQMMTLPGSTDPLTGGGMQGASAFGPPGGGMMGMPGGAGVGGP